LYCSNKEFQNIRNDFYRLKAVNQNSSKTIRLAVIGDSGSGKSTLINYMITNVFLCEFPSLVSSSEQTGTKIPIIYSFCEENHITITPVGESLLYDVKESTPYIFETKKQKEITNLLNKWNKEYKTIDYIRFAYPKAMLKNSILAPIKTPIEIIDLIGGPDELFFNKNKFCLNKLNQEIDAIFLVKRLSNNRWRCTTNDINSMYESGLFDRYNKFQTPKLVLCRIGNDKDTHNTPETTNKQKEELSLYIKNALSNFFKHRPTKNERNMFQNLESTGEENQKSIDYIKDKGKFVRGMMDRCDFLDLKPDRREWTMSELKQLMNHLSKDKKFSSILRSLHEAARIEKNLVVKLKVIFDFIRETKIQTFIEIIKP
jgi:adenylate kinase family enzyme